MISYFLIRQHEHLFISPYMYIWGVPDGSKNPPAHPGDTGLIPGLRRSPGQGNGNLLQYSCLGSPMDRGA